MPETSLINHQFSKLYSNILSRKDFAFQKAYLQRKKLRGLDIETLFAGFYPFLGEVLDVFWCVLIQVAQLRTECKRLQDQVNQLFEEKAKLAERLFKESEQLRIVRDNYNQQDKAMTERDKTIKDLKGQKKDLQGQITSLNAAQVASSEELQVNFILSIVPEATFSSWFSVYGM